MVELIGKTQCTGCLACESACPAGAIRRTRDILGNIYPEISPDLCIGCKKCTKACPQLQLPTFSNPKEAFAAWSLNPECRKSSASGGAAAEFYGAALERRYWICGAEYRPDGSVLHTVTRDPDAILRYKQSKYVFSDTGSVFSEIRNLLERGEPVLMISLPCKIAGLLGYLGKPYDNLLTVDIVCHGTPSDQLLKEHISHVAGVSDPIHLSFRQDNQFLFAVETEQKMVYRKIGREDPYLAAFLEGLSYRDSCYQCSYARPERISDITICDFWGLGQEIPFNHPYTGSISAVMLNTDRGQAFFEGARQRLFTERRPVTEVIRGNAQLNAPTPAHPQREDFVNRYAETDFEQTVSLLLKEQIRLARQENQKALLRGRLRRIAGIFIKRYRG